MVTAEFLDRLFGDGTGFIATAFGEDPCRDENGKYGHRKWSEKRYAYPGQVPDLQDVLQRIETSGSPVDVYFTPALRNTDARRGFGNKLGSNACPPRALWADCDTEPDPTKLEALGAMVVASGQPGHCHVYVLLERPVDVGTHRELNKALAAHLGADAKWSDDALLRLAGTRNWKAAFPPAGVEAGPPALVEVIR